MICPYEVDTFRSEAEEVSNLIRRAQHAVSANSDDCDLLLEELYISVGRLVWRQPWFKVDLFNYFAKSPFLFFEPETYQSLISEGRVAVQKDDMDGLDKVVGKLYQIKIDSSTGEEMLESTNILR